MGDGGGESHESILLYGGDAGERDVGYGCAGEFGGDGGWVWEFEDLLFGM